MKSVHQVIVGVHRAHTPKSNINKATHVNIQAYKCNTTSINQDLEGWSSITSLEELNRNFQSLWAKEKPWEQPPFLAWSALQVFRKAWLKFEVIWWRISEDLMEENWRTWCSSSWSDARLFRGKRKSCIAFWGDKVEIFDLVWCSYEKPKNVWPKTLQKSTNESAHARAFCARFLLSLLY